MNYQLEIIPKEKLGMIERFLFNLTEPPYSQSSEELAVEYNENVQYLHNGDHGDWDVNDYLATAEEIEAVVQDRMEWLQSKNK